MDIKYGPEIENARGFIEGLSLCKKVTFVTTSTRSPYVEKNGESPKSSQLARSLAKSLESRNIKVDVIDGAKLNIHACLGCVSEIHGNACGVIEAKLKDKEKNPNGKLRCWASVDFPDDELWKLSKSIYESQAVIFFGSQRWGSVNSIYQKIIERLDWMENMHTTLGEENSIKDISAGMVLIGQNWRVQESLELQKKVLGLFGFKTDERLFMGWQYTRDMYEESQKAYQNAPDTFEQSWGIPLFHWKKKPGTELSVHKELSESTHSYTISFDEFLKKVEGL